MITGLNFPKGGFFRPSLAQKNRPEGRFFLFANLGEAMVCISLDTLTGETLVCTHRPVNNQVALNRPCFIDTSRVDFAGCTLSRHQWLILVDSVEKVGLGYHGGKVGV